MFGLKRNIEERKVEKFATRSMKMYPKDTKVMPLVIAVDFEAFEASNDLPLYIADRFSCLSCHATFNMYCLPYEDTSRWKCSICHYLNLLPLPPTNSFDTSYTLAARSIPYNNIAYDFIDRKEQHINLRPHIIIAIHSRFPLEVIKTLPELVKKDKNDIDYTLLLFGNNLEVYDFKIKRFLVICHDPENSGTVFIPTAFDNLKGSANELVNILEKINLPHGFGCCFRSLTNLIKLFPECHSRKVVCFLNGSTFSIYPSDIRIPMHLFLYSYKRDSLGYLSKLLTLPGTHVSIYSDFNSTLAQSDFNLQADKALNRPAMGNAYVDLIAPKSMNVDRICSNGYVFMISPKNGVKIPKRICIQLAVRFNDSRGRSVIRSGTFSLKFTDSEELNPNFIFKNPFTSLFSVAALFVDTARKMADSPNYNVVGQKILNISYEFPMREIYPNFVFGFLQSSFIRKPTPAELMIGTIAIRTEAPIIQFLEFCPLEYVNDQLLPAVPCENEGALARLTSKGIFIKKSACGGVEGPNEINVAYAIAQKALIKAGFSRAYDHPVLIVDEFKHLPDMTREYNIWIKRWMFNASKRLNE